jgi:hypothetical protein
MSFQAAFPNEQPATTAPKNVGYQRKKEPTTLPSLLLEGVSSQELDSLLGRRAQLIKLLHQSSIGVYEATLTTDFAKAYSNIGMFGRGPAVRKEVNALVTSQEPFVIDHLRVMNQIKQIGPK